MFTKQHQHQTPLICGFKNFDYFKQPIISVKPLSDTRLCNLKIFHPKPTSSSLQLQDSLSRWLALTANIIKSNMMWGRSGRINDWCKALTRVTINCVRQKCVNYRRERWISIEFLSSVGGRTRIVRGWQNAGPDQLYLTPEQTPQTSPTLHRDYNSQIKDERGIRKWWGGSQSKLDRPSLIAGIEWGGQRKKALFPLHHIPLCNAPLLRPPSGKNKQKTFHPNSTLLTSYSSTIFIPEVSEWITSLKTTHVEKVTETLCFPYLCSAIISSIFCCLLIHVVTVL